MLVSVILAAFLMIAITLFHYFVLRWLSGGMSRISMAATTRILAIVFSVFMAHIIEIVIYSVAFAVSDKLLSLGDFGGRAVETPLDYLYFSIVSYTSLGLGDTYPIGHLRFLTGVESLNGLLLIAWSASFIYLAMGRLWPWTPCTEPGAEPETRRP
jgi:hypothetical protein|tara:strand:+ start:406 stop:873 length:468 start_codon:yes stop_codon:yes gene_type:complete